MSPCLYEVARLDLTTLIVFWKNSTPIFVEQSSVWQKLTILEDNLKDKDTLKYEENFK